MKPKVSFVIPAHNAQAYIAEALNSVLLQSVNEVEAVVILDGCTDAT